MLKSIGNALFQIFIALLIGIGIQWAIGINWFMITLVLTILIIINWAARLPGNRCADLMNSFRDLGRIAVTLAISVVFRILFWSAFGFSLIESLSTGHGVGPRGAMNLATSGQVRETIIWELLLDGAIITFSFLLAKIVVPTKQITGETNVSH